MPLPAPRPVITIADIVWQPNSSQWRLIWTLSVLIVLFWPGQQNRSLAIKALNWIADPNNTLPRLPDDFSLEVGEDPNIVTAHDTQEAEYRRIYAGSSFVRLRIRLRDMPEPFDPTTQKQVLAAIGVLANL